MKLPTWLTTISPLASRLAKGKKYRRADFTGDLIAGLIVAIMLVPQAMAYAMLAGLPPQVGLYASIVPLLLYSFLGSSNSLAVGPVAMISLLVVAGVGQLATPGSAEFISLCFTLALLAGAIQILMAVFRLGFLVNFISHPVLAGFTSAAAIVIGFSQVRHLTGAEVTASEYPVVTIWNTFTSLMESNLATLIIGVSSVVVLVFFARALTPLLKKTGLSTTSASTISKVGPLVAVVLGALVVGSLGMHREANVAIVGEIPAGLPGLTMPNLSWVAITSLLPLALVITMVGYLESISVAKALASRRREKVDANRELFALGMADVGAAFTGGYPVTGGFSRSVVNFSAGVRTPLGSVITALLVAVSVLFLTPLFFYIPKAVLAAIIVVAVTTLIDVKTPIRLWKYSRSDAIALLITFAGVLLAGIETGIIIGIAATAVLYMWRASRPHIAEVGRLPGTEHFRNIARHNVETVPGVLAVRVDESLTFANAPCLESWLLAAVADRPDVHSVLLVATGINQMDATGIEVLETVREELQGGGVELYLSDVKGPVSDMLVRYGFDEPFLANHVFLSADLALRQLENHSSESVVTDESAAPAPGIAGASQTPLATVSSSSSGPAELHTES